MIDRDNFNPDQYQTSLKQEDLNSPVGKVASKAFLNEERQFLVNNDKKNFKGSIPFSQFRLFVPLDPTEPLSGNNSLRLGKSVIIFSVFGSLWIAFSALTFNWLQMLIRTPFIVTLLIYLLSGVFFLYIIIAKIIYRVEDKRRDAAMNRGNKSMNLGNVWGINPGGIVEGKALGRKHTTVYYKGKGAIVLKILKKSVLVSSDMADWSHYEGLQRLEDIMIKYGFNYTKRNMKYDTENDYIWDELNDSLNKSSMIFGKKYTDLMNEIYVYQRNFTKSYSTVPVIYYIIKPEFVNTKKDFNQLMIEMSNIVQMDCRCTLEPVSNKEFLRLLKEYYGVSYLDTDSISEFIASSNEINIDVNMVAYLNNKGELVRLKEDFKPQLPNKFKRIEMVMNERDVKVEPEVNITEQHSIFGDKNIKQYGS